MTQKNEGRAKAAQRDLKVNSTTRSDTLDLANGLLTLTVTETPDRVFVAFSGAVPRLEEASELGRFLFPIFLRFELDARPIEISGTNSSVTALLFGQGSKAVGVMVSNEVLADLVGGRA